MTPSTRPPSPGRVTDLPAPAVLSNGTLTTVVTQDGGGQTMLGAIALTRCSPDPAHSADGPQLYIRDVERREAWPLARLPGSRTPDAFEADLGEGRARIRRRDGDIQAMLEVRLSPDEDVELRLLTLSNLGQDERSLDVTSYAEVVLASPAADTAHPAFSKLFVQTALLPQSGALVAWRRPRDPDERWPILVHLLRPVGERAGPQPEVETDRMRFIGRGRGLAAPAALDREGALSGTTGNVLDPVVAVRRPVRLAPGGSARVLAVTGVAPTRAAAETLARRYATGGQGEDAFEKSGSEPPTALRPLAPPVAAGPFRPAGAPDAASAASPSTAVPDGGAAADPEQLRFFNGFGGFSPGGDEYVIRMPPGERGPMLPPLPWTHVVANDDAGFIVSERGAACTWAVNSRENRLTPWYNDPVSDPHGEALYVRDEDAGVFWSPTPGPVPAPVPYEARWGFGSATWRSVAFDLDQEVVAFVPRSGPLRILRLRLRNRADRPRRLSLFSYAQWVLGTHPVGGEDLVSRVDERTRTVLAQDPSRAELGARVAFAATVPPDGAVVEATGNRIAFLGGRRDLHYPAALRTDAALVGREGIAADACAAFRVALELGPGEEASCAFLLGEGEDLEGAWREIARFPDLATVEAELTAVRREWAELTGRLQVATPSPALDLMVNGWLTYQDLCCRIRARSAFYQSGGAFGFRDQLQDAAALVYVDPALTRGQILLHAGHQFLEGDVLHWWHPPASKGIRTRFSDDLLWLPYVTAFYLAVTGDAGVLDEQARYLAARPLEADEDEAFLVPDDSGESGTLFEHCCRALDRSLTAGPHGLPLMGTGDWNDGMNRVGRGGLGESVWLGFFLYSILEDFVPLCEARGDAVRAGRYRAYRAHLREALNGAGWDGEWYRRAYYDDGAPLGSASGDECRIDAIAQAWAVLSGAAPPERAERALDALELHLVRERDGLIALLAPPFDRTPHDPGYIKGYLPGVRENGGQYTHGALWAVRALAEAGRCERAAPLLELLDPVSHARTPEEVAVYQVEPYVVAADVYGVAPHIGRGGWTWYTGSAGWMLRVALESVLGLTVEGGRSLRLRPCIPASWPGFRIEYRLPGDDAVYDIRVTRGSGAGAATLDGQALALVDGAVVAALVRDGARHELEVVMGTEMGPRYRER